SNLVYVNTSTVRVLQAWDDGLPTDYIGQIVCISAPSQDGFGGEGCGPITHLSETIFENDPITGSPNVALTGQRTASISAAPGDSGAGVYTFNAVEGGYIAVGILSGCRPDPATLTCQSNSMRYSHISHAVNELGLDGIYTAS